MATIEQFDRVEEFAQSINAPDIAEAIDNFQRNQGVFSQKMLVRDIREQKGFVSSMTSTVKVDYR